MAGNNKLTVEWDGRSLSKETFRQSVTALQEHEPPPVPSMAIAIKGNVPEDALWEIEAVASRYNCDIRVKLTATFGIGQQLALFGPGASATLDTLTDIDDFLSGNKPEE